VIVLESSNPTIEQKPKYQRMKRMWKILVRDKYLLLMFLPFIVFYIVFSYIPMVGLNIAFRDFRPGGGIFGGDWVGLQWFRQFFNSIFFGRLVRNTVLLSLYELLWGFPVPILFAICINEVRHSLTKRVVQTVSYLPFFVSTVVMVGILHNFFNINDGIVNRVIVALGGERVNFLTSTQWFRTLFVGSGIWQGFGFASIIYIAAITGIDPTYYEAAKMDGISKFKEVFYITIPMISQTIIILLLLQIGGLMSTGFEKVFLMQTPVTFEVSDVITTYVFRRGIGNFDFSFGAAVGFFNSVVTFIFVYTANRISRVVTNAGLW